MADGATRPDDGARFVARLTDQRRLAILLLPVLLVGSLMIARATAASARPTAIGLTGGAQNATTELLATTAADLLRTALSTGAGVEFEVVQTSTITQRKGGPLVGVPDQKDRNKTKGEAPRYVIGTLIERGFAAPSGYWMELIHGPVPGAEATYDVEAGQVSRQALIRDGKLYRNDGEGWHETDQLPGIGLDPVTLTKLIDVLAAARNGKDLALETKHAIDPKVAKEAKLGPETVAVEADAVVLTIKGLRGSAKKAVRALGSDVDAAQLPGIIAIDLATATELRGPAELRFDEDGRLVGLRVLARNTKLDVHDLLVETVIQLRYPDSPPDLPTPEPVYVAPAPASDEEGES